MRYGACVTEQIRINYDVRRAPAEQIIAELEQFAQDRERVGKQERADGARAAAARIAAGEQRVQFEFTAYIVDEEPSRNAVRRGTREWVLAELRESEVGWTHQGNRPLSWQAHCAVAEVEQGATSVRVGHIEYEVADEG